MKYFTQENTEGFSDEMLLKMNKDLESLMSTIDIDSDEYEQMLKHYSEKIFNLYC